MFRLVLYNHYQKVSQKKKLFKTKAENATIALDFVALLSHNICSYVVKCKFCLFVYF